jgi:hypothetical protein
MRLPLNSEGSLPLPVTKIGRAIAYNSPLPSWERVAKA